MSTEERIVVIGAGGHAKVVISTLQACGRRPVRAFDDDPGKWGSELLGVPIVGPVSEAANEKVDGAIVAVGDNQHRARLVESLELSWLSAVHPAAFVHPTVRLGSGSVVFAGAVIQPDVKIGGHAIINTSTTVDHDCRLGELVHLAPGVRLGGGVQIGAGSLIGIGAAVIPNVVIGSWAVVGAGAAVIARLPDGCTAVGVPAKVREA